MANITGESVALWLLIAMLTGLITYTLWRIGKMKASTAIAIPILIFYMAFVLTITIIERMPLRQRRANLELFWTVKAIIDGRRYLASEIFWNIVLFVPIGTVVATILRKYLWVCVILGAVLSIGIEVTQLLTHRGLFEFDDILHNTIGAVIGLLLYLVVKNIGSKTGGAD